MIEAPDLTTTTDNSLAGKNGPISILGTSTNHLVTRPDSRPSIIHFIDRDVGFEIKKQIRELIDWVYKHRENKADNPPIPRRFSYISTIVPFVFHQSPETGEAEFYIEGETLESHASIRVNYGLPSDPYPPRTGLYSGFTITFNGFCGGVMIFSSGHEGLTAQTIDSLYLGKTWEPMMPLSDDLEIIFPPVQTE